MCHVVYLVHVECYAATLLSGHIIMSTPILEEEKWNNNYTTSVRKSTHEVEGGFGNKR